MSHIHILHVVKRYCHRTPSWYLISISASCKRCSLNHFLLLNMSRLSLISLHLSAIWTRQIDTNFIQQQVVQRGTISQIDPLPWSCPLFCILTLTCNHEVVALWAGSRRWKPDLLIGRLLVDDVRADGWKCEGKNSSLYTLILRSTCENQGVIHKHKLRTYAVFNVNILSILLQFL